MARIGKNGNLSGAIGNIVFVNDGDRTFVRAKPATVRQTAKTKAAADVFGVVSSKEKALRLQLLNRMGFPAVQYMAARHRARLRKTVREDVGGHPVFTTPEALIGFDFNPAMEWARHTNFYPVVSPASDGTLEMHIPELKWGRQVLPPPHTDAARLTLCAFTVDMNAGQTVLTEVARQEVNFRASGVQPAQTWALPMPQPGCWMLVVGGLRFSRSGKSSGEGFSGSYVWCG